MRSSQALDPLTHTQGQHAGLDLRMRINKSMGYTSSTITRRVQVVIPADGYYILQQKGQDTAPVLLGSVTFCVCL